MQNTNKSKKIIFSLTCLLLIIFSLFFVLVETNHKCEGHDCLICYVIHLSENNIKLVKILFKAIIAFSLFCVVQKIFILKNVFNLKIVQTLVSKKIKLNN